MRIPVLVCFALTFFLVASGRSENQRPAKPREYYCEKKPVPILRITNWPTGERGCGSISHLIETGFSVSSSSENGQYDYIILELNMGVNPTPALRKINLQNYQLIILENIETLPEFFIQKLIKSTELGNAVITVKCPKLDLKKQLLVFKKPLGPLRGILSPQFGHQAFSCSLGLGYVVLDPFNKGLPEDFLRSTFMLTHDLIIEKINTRTSKATLSFKSTPPKHIDSDPIAGKIHENQILYAHEGSHVNINFKPTVQFETATLSSISQNGNKADVRCKVMPVNTQDGIRDIEASMHVDGNMDLILSLVSKNKAKRIDVRYRVYAIPDLPPVIKTNARSGICTARARLPLDFTVEDDHGIAKTHIEYRVNNGKFESAPAQLVGRKPLKRGEKINLNWDLGKNLPAPKVGDIYAFRVTSWDNNPAPNRKPTTSQILEYKVVTDEEKMNELQERMRKNFRHSP